MIQAATRGAVDFTHADPTDRKWNSRLLLALYAIERENVEKIVSLNNARCVALLGNSALTKESFEKLREESEKLTVRVKSLLMPWVETDKSSGRDGAINRLTELWIKTWGDPKDPAVAARINATADALMKASAPKRRR